MANPQSSTRKLPPLFPGPDRPQVARDYSGSADLAHGPRLQGHRRLSTRRNMSPAQEVVPRADMGSRAARSRGRPGRRWNSALRSPSHRGDRCAAAWGESGFAGIPDRSSAAIAVPHAGRDRAGPRRHRTSLPDALRVASGERGARQLSGFQRCRGEQDARWPG